MRLQILVCCLASLLPSYRCILPYYAPAPVYSYPKSAYVPAPVAYAAPALHADHVETIDPNPSYHFKYGVNDPNTGDYKTAEEYRKDGVVQGSYSLAEPDGTIRTVHYAADHVHGFNAVVDKHSARAAVHAPAILAAKYQTVVPSYYHGPATHAYSYAAPYPYSVYHR